MEGWYFKEFSILNAPSFILNCSRTIPLSPQKNIGGLFSRGSRRDGILLKGPGTLEGESSVLTLGGK